MTPRTDPFPHAARCIVRDFAKDHEWGPFRGQEALAKRLGYRHRESITPWFRGLTTGKTEGQTTPDTNARKRLWAVMLEHAPGTAQAVKSLNVPLRREIEAALAETPPRLPVRVRCEPFEKAPPFGVWYLRVFIHAPEVELMQADGRGRSLLDMETLYWDLLELDGIEDDAVLKNMATIIAGQAGLQISRRMDEAGIEPSLSVAGSGDGLLWPCTDL